MHYCKHNIGTIKSILSQFYQKQINGDMKERYNLQNE